MTFDVIIKGGEVIDGSGKARVRADVGLRGDTIAAVGDLSEDTASKIIDAKGKVVTPGFIDMHSHSDLTILMYPCGESSVSQGVTTSVGGQCSFSAAPLNKHWSYAWWEGNWWHKVAPSKYYDEIVGCLDKAKIAVKEAHGLDVDWSSFGEWVSSVEKAGPGLNVRPLVGHGTIRTAVMGTDYRREATPSEIAEMVKYVDEAMDSGAAGISNGADYAPNSYCSEEEECALVGAAAKKGGYFSTHWRRTGLREGFGNPGLADGLREAIRVAKKTGAQLQVAHLAPGWLTTPGASPKITACIAEETLALLDDAVKDGVNLGFDVIPNSLTGGVTHGKYVAGELGPWFKEAGSLEQLAKNLKAPDLRAEIREYIMSGRWFRLNPPIQPTWANGVRVGASTVDRYVGKTIAQIASETGVDSLEALMDVVCNDPYATGAWGEESDEVKRIFYRHPLAMVGMDTFLVDHTFEIKIPPYTLPNPNSFGGMAKFLRLYAQGFLGLEEGVRRITGLSAKTLGIKDRGLIAEGMKADVVVFAPEKVTEKGTYEEPRQYAEGFSWVFVNGVAALADGKLTHSHSGKVLRR